ncbi:MAG TPA: HNH endonuclease [Armatimonadaceae bacterium]|nr:HNH endonuclease [Armatimonadaceae bacterium]
MEESTRAFVTQRAGGRCEYCQCPADHSPSDFAVEHVYPRARGGTDASDNLAYACQGCNNRKFTATTARDLLTDLVVPLFDPRRDHWHDHFQWSADGREIIGKTATGRATVERLQLNREAIANLRIALVAIGKHPPAGTAAVGRPEETGKP